MTEAAERDRGLLSLIDRLVKKPGPVVATKAPHADQPAIDDGAREGLDPIVTDDAPQASLEPQLAVESTRSVSRSELASLVLKALQATEQAPISGVEITIYGERPWNAMLRVTPAAGPVKADLWRERLRTVVVLFRERYDVMPDAST
ncbi:MAG: hypothetical protein EON84_21260 [Bradyrhizobiaceae bacterium]|nr:MAG: hypothetical protein EON84_21260 [Bradyrhizobiaceae bacterium]